MTPDPVFISCILGRSDSLRAEVFFRVELPPGVAPGEATLSGALTGPDCRHAITLPVTAKLAVARGGTESVDAATLVARAVLTEPSYWTPELPNRYRLEARLEADGRELAVWRRPLGLRRFGVRGRSLWLDGRRYVPRGLVAAAVDVAAFRAAGLAAIVADPNEAFLDRCDAEGVAVIGLLADQSGRPFDVPAATAAIARWAWHPAMLAAVVPQCAAVGTTSAIAAAVRGRRDTVLLGREVDGSTPSVEVVAGIDLVVVSLPPGGLPHDAWRIAPPAVPLLVRRAREKGAESEPSRRGCDALQAALAVWRAGEAPGPQPDWAGYLVD